MGSPKYTIDTDDQDLHIRVFARLRHIETMNDWMQADATEIAPSPDLWSSQSH